MNHDGNLVPGFQRAPLPAAPKELRRRTHFDAPFDRTLRPGNQDLDPTMRIGPLIVLDGAGERRGLLVVEHCPAMMSETLQCEQQRRDTDKNSTSVHRADRFRGTS